MTNLQTFIAYQLPRMEGWCSQEKASAMADLILAEKPNTVVEIGVFGGRSLIPQALALQANDKGTIYGIDPWKKEAALEGEVGAANAEWWNSLDLHKIHNYCMDQIWANQLDKFCIILQTSSHHCAHLFNRIDILHLDGNHSELSSCRDVNNYLPYVRPGGFIWFDDTDWTTTQKAIQLIESSNCEKIKTVGTCNLYLKKQ